MLTVSLHGIRIIAPIGLYPEEKIKPNTFEVDVDVRLPVAAGSEWPFVDYTIINSIVTGAFSKSAELLETLVRDIHKGLKEQFAEAGNVRVAIRKLSPPMPGNVQYAQVSFEG